MHALSHQCRVVLHGSLVPHFSGLPLQSAMPLEAVRTSARIALESAKAISQLGADLLALQWNPARLAPFVGYCMYVAASIHVALIISRDDIMARNARLNLLTSLNLLEAMKPFWNNLQRLVSNILHYQNLHRQLTMEVGSSYSSLQDPNCQASVFPRQEYRCCSRLSRRFQRR